MLGNSKLQAIIWTSCIPAAERFYSDVLGLHCRGKSDGALVYAVGGSDLRISPVPSTQPTAHTVMGFAVEHLQLILGELARRGINCERFPGLGQTAQGVLTAPSGAQVVWIRDPDGNLLSIVQFAS